jgi:2-iminobutanoate/2-iminopropanoate deaminase
MEAGRMRHVAGRLCVVPIALALAGCTIEERTDRETSPAPDTRRQVIQPEGIPRLPVFSSAIRSGDLIFLSGQIGALPGVSPPELVEGGIEPETRQTMENIVATLDAAGATLADIVKCTVFLADMADYDGMNQVYLEYFPSDPPARSAMGANGLALGARVEIECIAAAPAA